MIKLFLMFLCVLFGGCGSAKVYVVEPIDYTKASYTDRVIYVGSLHEANQINLTNKNVTKVIIRR